MAKITSINSPILLLISGLGTKFVKQSIEISKSPQIDSLRIMITFEVQKFIGHILNTKYPIKLHSMRVVCT